MLWPPLTNGKGQKKKKKIIQSAKHQQSINKFNQTLKKIDIAFILNEYNSNYAFESVMDTYSKAFDVNFPLSSCTKNQVTTNHGLIQSYMSYLKRKIKLLVNT